MSRNSRGVSVVVYAVTMGAVLLAIVATLVRNYQYSSTKEAEARYSQTLLQDLRELRSMLGRMEEIGQVRTFTFRMSPEATYLSLLRTPSTLTVENGEIRIRLANRICPPLLLVLKENGELLSIQNQVELLVEKAFGTKTLKLHGSVGPISSIAPLSLVFSLEKVEENTFHISVRA